MYTDICQCHLGRCQATRAARRAGYPLVVPVALRLSPPKARHEHNVITNCYGERTHKGNTTCTQTATPPKRDTLNIRIKPEVRDLIDRAAKSRGKNRTDFILDSARQAAEDTLLDQVIMAVSPQALAQFQARLDIPPQPNARLQATMRTPARWDGE